MCLPSGMDLEGSAAAIVDNIGHVIDGKAEVAETALVVLLAEGHLLIEDVPGVGKTVLAKALARSVSCSVRRIQFTPDLLPSDITGVSVFNVREREFEFKPGAVFANIVIGDEINRASPKTQSALLEAMEERQVTVDGTTYGLGSPFTVVATQNPYEMEGTYALPEAQRDRFMARISMGYPDAGAELEMVRGRDDVQPVRRPRGGGVDGGAARDDRGRPSRLRVARRSRATPSTSCGPPASTASCASAPAPGPRSSWSAPARPSPPSTDATTCCPTTSTPWCPRSCRTGSSPIAVPPVPRTSCTASSAETPVPDGAIRPT